MANPIYDSMTNPGSSVYYEEGFRDTIETYLPFLRSLATTNIVEVTANDAYRFEGDFYGLLGKMGIAPHLHWIVMRVNGMTASTDLTTIIATILVPTNAAIDNIVRMYRASNRIQ